MRLVCLYHLTTNDRCSRDDENVMTAVDGNLVANGRLFTTPNSDNDVNHGTAAAQQPAPAGGLDGVRKTILTLIIYTVNHKKRATLFLIITLAFLCRFLYFLYHWKQEGILYK